MRATEFIPELVTRADTTEHLINRALVAAAMCEKLGDHPLLFRQFTTGIRGETVIAKVENDRGPKLVKSGSNPKTQIKILELLDVKNPVFCRTKQPNESWGFHGDPHILIPPDTSQIFWSPVIEDLGGGRFIQNGKVVRLGKTDRGVTQHDSMLPDAEKWASTYKQGWPDIPTDNEIIVDAPSYYLINIQVLLKKFAGDEMKGMLKLPPRVPGQFPAMHWIIDPATWEKLSTYSQVAWYLKNPFVKFVRWYQENEENKPLKQRPIGRYDEI